MIDNIFISIEKFIKTLLRISFQTGINSLNEVQRRSEIAGQSCRELVCILMLDAV